MKYKLRNGIILKEFCGEYALIATLEAKEYCPYVRQINETGAFYWKLLSRGLDVEEMVEAAAQEYQVEAERVRPGLCAYIAGLEKLNYIIPEEMAG